MNLVAPISLSLVAGVALGYFVIPKSTEDSQQNSSEQQTKKYKSLTSSKSLTTSSSSKSGYVGEYLNTSVVLKKTSNQYLDYSIDQFRDAALEIENLPFHEQGEQRILLFKAWAKTNPAEALAFIEGGEIKLNQGHKFYTKSLVYSVWGENDPAAAAAALAESGDVRNRSFGSFDSYSEHVVGAWAKQDPAGAFEWIQDLTSKQRKNVLTGYMKSLYEENPELAQQQLLTLPADEQDEAVEGFAEIWGKQEDWSSIQLNVDGLPEDLQKDALKSALNSFSKENAEEARAILADIDIDANSKDRLVYSLSRDLVSEDPQQAIEWAQSVASKKADDSVTRYLFANWSRDDTKGASEWLLAQPQGSNTNTMIQQALRVDGISEAEATALRDHVDKSAVDPNQERMQRMRERYQEQAKQRQAE